MPGLLLAHGEEPIMISKHDVIHKNNNTKTDLGKRISAASGEIREVSFLFQRISVVVQRFNAVLLHNSFVEVDQPE